MDETRTPMHKHTARPLATTTASSPEEANERPEVEDHSDPYRLGGCPKCCRWDNCLSLGSEDWVVCYRHRTKFMWAGGGGTWGEPEEAELRNRIILDQLTDVEPAYPAIFPDEAAAFLRLADAVCDEHFHPRDADDGKARKEQLVADAALVRRWVAFKRTTWVQRIRVSDEENPLVKGADQR